MITTPPENEFLPEPPSQKKGVPIVVWLLAGCGCSVFGVILLGIVAGVAIFSGILNSDHNFEEITTEIYISSVVSAQKTYYSKNKVFASSDSELELEDLEGSFSSNFSYKMVDRSKEFGQPIVEVTAQALGEDLHSYIGVVVKIGDTLESVICKTDEPSTQIPRLIHGPKTPPKPLTCPPGSTLLDDWTVPEGSAY